MDTKRTQQIKPRLPTVTQNDFKSFLFFVIYEAQIIEYFSIYYPSIWTRRLAEYNGIRCEFQTWNQNKQPKVVFSLISKDNRNKHVMAEI